MSETGGHVNVFLTLVVTFLGSGAGAAAVSWGMSRDESKRERRGSTSDGALDALGKLDTYYRNVSQGEADPADMTQIESDANIAISKCGSDQLAGVYYDWREFGRRYASEDEDAGEEEYERRFEDVLREVRAAIKRLA